MTSLPSDIPENKILEKSPELLSTLLLDRTLSSNEKPVNIFWATDNYAERGTGYQYSDQITIEAITGANGNVIVPRALKSRETQKKRSREKAEVFTPSWVCNKQCNLVDKALFERENVFNTEIDNPDGTHTWIVSESPVTFPASLTWEDYVSQNCLEITCGEAPYLVSRYDTVTGDAIPLERRIGLLDRKLRIVNENTDSPSDWLKWTIQAFKSTYGYEWQGDNLLLAREAMLYTFIDYYQARFSKEPELKLLLEIAEIVSWNIWQMDGLKGVIPGSCVQLSTPPQSGPLSLFTDEELGIETPPTLFDCPGCKKMDFFQHTGTYCKIMDWDQGHPILFISLMNKNKDK